LLPKLGPRLWADGYPVYALGHWHGAIGFNSNLAAPGMHLGHQVLTELHHWLAASADDEWALAAGPERQGRVSQIIGIVAPAQWAVRTREICVAEGAGCSKVAA